MLQAAWNAHDMSEFVSLFDDGPTFVNRFGHYVRGIDEMVALHVPIHETTYSIPLWIKSSLMLTTLPMAWRLYISGVG